MKLIIDIPQTAYDAIQAVKVLPLEKANEGTLENVLIEAVENGIPLDKIRDEIEQTADSGKHWNVATVSGLRIAIDIIDRYREGEH